MERGAGASGELACAGEVVGVDVGVEHAGDAHTAARGLVQVGLHVGSGVDDERLGSGGQEVGEAAACLAAELHDSDRAGEGDLVVLQDARPADQAAVHAAYLARALLERGGGSSRCVAGVADDPQASVSRDVGERRVRVRDELGLGHVHDLRASRADVPGVEVGTGAGVDDDDVVAASQLVLEGGGLELGHVDGRIDAGLHVRPLSESGATRDRARRRARTSASRPSWRQ